MQPNDAKNSYQPFSIEGADRPSRWLITCDHAANTIPPGIADLGLGPGDMDRHIAFDPGAAGVTRALARRLEASTILSNFSRLVIDPNRGEHDPTLVMKLYDGSIVPGNRHVDAAEVERRKALCYRPYHTAYAELADRVADTVIVSIHSYTRQLAGMPPRPWHVGVLHASDDRLSLPLLTRLEAETDLCVGLNEPYGGHLPGDSVWRHALAHGRQNTLIEIRNDLIRTETQQEAWAARLAPLLEAALADAEMTGG